MSPGEDLQAQGKQVIEQNREHSAATEVPTPLVLHIGLSRRQQISRRLDSLAANPGDLVYIESTRLSSRICQLEPIVFTAIDACTHLQVARMYLTESTASAIDFTEFALVRFPFPVLQIRTMRDAPFYTSSKIPMRQRFSEYLHDRGILHSTMSSPLRDELYPHLSRFSFSKMAAGSLTSVSTDDLADGLSSYLQIHNNHRELPALQGRTPLRKLQSFKKFSQLYSFEPFSFEPQLI